ncbi:hypothetical protein [Erythrobacter sp.]|uniref:hypothetical protein n=1 Tax=Sphingomonadales TaxID=204457 RepID=UPI003262DC2E
MKFKNLLLASALSAMTLTAPAAACDFDGIPEMGGFHRMNPFAKTLGGFDVPRPLPQPQTTAENANKDEKAKAIEATPVREWAIDCGNGTITEKEKATFT